MFPKTKTTSHKNWSRNASIGSARYDAVSNINPRTGWSADMRLPALRERIYSSTAENENPMAGILIYTAAPDSEGTLGGLVTLGETNNLELHFDQALEGLEICSSDPLCAETQPEQAFMSLHGSAWHNCLFLPETSCERGNRYLDRATLVPTMERTAYAFFRR